ncbi:hypothetical protein [uncultured Tateyamaria sp.]|uniref:hypothetical protein n=1 Tax=uncultured Tateyamaria sp. TaxID=455651 RepID=UPI00262F5318|nr:hypothetical protein [uncultured Tateyamaria sp.]
MKPALGGDGGFLCDAAVHRRRPDAVGTLWIAHILDDGGLLYEARFAHFVIQ